MSRPTLSLVLVLALFLSPMVLAQPGTGTPAASNLSITPVPNSENVTITFPPSPVPVSDFFRTWSATTGLNFFYSENMLRGKAIRGLGVMTVHRAKLDGLFRSMLAPNGLAIMPSGPREASLYSVESLDSSRSLKQRAIFVPRSEVADLRDRSGEIFMTSFQLQHIEVNEVRQAFNMMLSNRNTEFVNEVRSSNTIIAVGWGHTLAAMDQALRAMDVVAPESIRKMRAEKRKGPGHPGGGR